jgi:hypothetical protein
MNGAQNHEPVHHLGTRMVASGPPDGASSNVPSNEPMRDTPESLARQGENWRSAA